MKFQLLKNIYFSCFHTPRKCIYRTIENVYVQTIVAILTFTSMILMLSWFKHEQSSLALGPELLVKFIIMFESLRM